MWQGCNTEEKMESRFPAIIGGGIDTKDLSDVDFGVWGTGGPSGASVHFEIDAGQIHRGSGTLRRREVRLGPTLRKRVLITV